MTNRYILTGAPGSGKSTLVLELESRGANIIKEAAEDVIKVYQAKGVAKPWELNEFQDRILDLQLQRESLATATQQPTYIDRGILDGLAYNPSCALRKRIETALGDSNRISYNKTVFFIEQLARTQQNQVRREDRAQATELEERLEGIYTAHGFEIVRVPPISIKRRVESILEYIKTTH